MGSGDRGIGVGVWVWNLHFAGGYVLGICDGVVSLWWAIVALYTTLIIIFAGLEYMTLWDESLRPVLKLWFRRWQWTAQMGRNETGGSFTGAMFSGGMRGRTDGCFDVGRGRVFRSVEGECAVGIDFMERVVVLEGGFVSLLDLVGRVLYLCLFGLIVSLGILCVFCNFVCGRVYFIWYLNEKLPHANYDVMLWRIKDIIVDFASGIDLLFALTYRGHIARFEYVVIMHRHFLLAFYSG